MRLKYMAEVLLAEFKLRMAKTPFTDQYCKCSLILDRGLCLHSVVRREFFAETNSHDLLCNWFVHQPDELDLVKIAIEPKLRGIGCGSLLYDVVCDTARACGIYRVRMIAGGHAKTEHADKSREAYLIRRGWSRKNGVMYKDVGDRGYVTKLDDNCSLFGVEHRPTNIGGGWRRYMTVMATDQLHAIGRLLPMPNGVSTDARGTREHPVQFNGSEWAAVPFSVWESESRDITGDPSFEPLEDYR